jgi:TonB family protein
LWGAWLAAPIYAWFAGVHNLSGRVELLVDVAADGSVANAVVERSEPKGVFDANALQAVKGWKFNPAIKDGKAVAAQVRVPVDFRPDPPQP